MRDGGHLQPGWALTLPADATPPHAHRPPGPATPEDPAGQPPRLAHQVVPDDWMWHLAGRYLDDETRYPEIAALNRHLADRYPNYPNHIQPGDRLLLPPGATDHGPRHHATGPAHPTSNHPPTQPPGGNPDEPTSPPPAPPTPSPPPTPGPPPTPAATPAAPARDPDGVIPPPEGAPPTTTSDPAAATPPAAPSPGQTSPGTGASGDAAEQPPADDHPGGVQLSDGAWIPWALAAALASAMAVVWQQRRRRYSPRRLHPDSPDPPSPTVGGEPAVLARIRRALHSRTGPAAPPAGGKPDRPEPEPDPAPPDTHPPPAAARLPAEPGEPPPVPELGRLPEGGTGLVGPGAAAAARAALTTALAAGAPTDPDAQTEVIIPADTLTSLLGTHPAAPGGWRRLRITPDLDTALTLVETRLLAAARLLDEYELTDLATLRQTAPAEQPLPPLLLVTTTPPAQARMRTRTALGLGHGQEISALLLGGWDHGPTLHVQPDGTCHPLGHSTHPAGQPTRLAVLDPAATTDLLHTLREAHTGCPRPDPTPPPAAGEPAAAQPPDTQPGPAPAAPPATLPVTEPGQTTPAVPAAVVSVLGTPQIHNAQTAGRPLRTAAVELLVYLAVHPDGADPDQIQEHLWPDTRRRLAAATLHTAASNLRHTLAAAARAHPQHAAAYLRKDKGRYRLGPEAVQIDLWTLQAACTRARHLTGPHRAQALREACQTYPGELAAGRDYQWITPHRERTRQLALDAHTTLAQHLTDQDPAEAARLLTRAVEIDPMAEHVYQQAMRAHHHLGDAHTIQTLLRQLARHLDSIGAQPDDHTIEPAGQLRHDLTRRARPPDAVTRPPPPASSPTNPKPPPAPTRTR
jgi:DNA-binding SARP family transcriptional activator